MTRWHYASVLERIRLDKIAGIGRGYQIPLASARTINDDFHVLAVNCARAQHGQIILVFGVVEG